MGMSAQFNCTLAKYFLNVLTKAICRILDVWQRYVREHSDLIRVCNFPDAPFWWPNMLAESCQNNCSKHNSFNILACHNWENLWDTKRCNSCSRTKSGQFIVINLMDTSWIQISCLFLAAALPVVVFFFSGLEKISDGLLDVEKLLFQCICWQCYGLQAI